MKLFDILKQFKEITPDEQFVARTKRDVLASPHQEPLTVRGIFAVFRMVETGVVVALAGLFLVILTGGFGKGGSISPVQYSVIDPADLRAEAQAIDTQIQLADISYPQMTSTANSVPSAAEADLLTQALTKVLTPKSATSTAPGAVATSTAADASSTAAASTTTLSVDQALQQLSH